jgi:hypothetical protein
MERCRACSLAARSSHSYAVAHLTPHRNATNIVAQKYFRGPSPAERSVEDTMESILAWNIEGWWSRRR